MFFLLDIKMMTQQKHIIQFLMTSTIPINLIAPIFQIQQALTRLQQINNLNRYKQNVRYVSKKKATTTI
jgi:hypothetical protein